MSEEDRETIKNAVESGDYESWASVKRAQITEEKFQEIRARHAERAEFRAQMENARENGDYEEMQQLKEQYGIGNKMGRGMRMKQGFSGECPYAE